MKIVASTQTPLSSQDEFTQILSGEISRLSLHSVYTSLQALQKNIQREVCLQADIEDGRDGAVVTWRGRAFQVRAAESSITDG